MNRPSDELRKLLGTATPEEASEALAQHLQTTPLAVEGVLGSAVQAYGAHEDARYGGGRLRDDFATVLQDLERALEGDGAALERVKAHPEALALYESLLAPTGAQDFAKRAAELD